jgi:hypothetical protein
MQAFLSSTVTALFLFNSVYFLIGFVLIVQGSFSRKQEQLKTIAYFMDLPNTEWFEENTKEENMKATTQDWLMLMEGTDCDSIGQKGGCGNDCPLLLRGNCDNSEMYQELKRDQLRTIAKHRGLTGYSKMLKADLLAALT